MSSEITAHLDAPDAPALREDGGARARARARARSLAEGRIEALGELVEFGLKIARAIARRVDEGEGEPLPVAELNAAAMGYARAARAVRLAVLLQERLSQGAVEAPEFDEEAARQAEALGRQAKVDRVVRIVKRVARDHCGHTGFALGAYAGEAKERLDNDDIYGLVATLPIGELVSMICEDLGLKPKWEYLAAEAWAQSEIESGAEGSPFVDDEEDDEDRDGEADEPDPGPSRPDWRRPTFQEKLLEHVPAAAAVVAAARRESG